MNGTVVSPPTIICTVAYDSSNLMNISLNIYDQTIYHIGWVHAQIFDELHMKMQTFKLDDVCVERNPTKKEIKKTAHICIVTL